MTDLGETTFPKMLHWVADDIAAMRVKANKKKVDHQPETGRGIREFEIQKLGILGELVAWHYVTETNQDEYEHTPLVARKTPKKGVASLPDLRNVRSGSRLDIKSAIDRFRVNCKSHGKRKARNYLFVVLPNGDSLTSIERECTKAHLYVYSWEEVDQWPAYEDGPKNAWLKYHPLP